MNIKVGDFVTRIKYQHDVIFKVLSIKGETAYLKGKHVRLYADAPLEDLILYQKEDRDLDEDEQFLDDFIDDNRGDFFYLPGKVLHIDADNQLSNKPTNPYKIRENTEFKNLKKSQKKQKISNFS